LEEGWAMLYGDHDEVGDTAGALRDAIASVESRGRLSGEYYALAMRFVAYVIEMHGIDALRGLCSVPTDTQVEFAEAVSNVLGMSFDTVLVEFDEYPTWSVGELRQDRACETQSASLAAPGSWALNMDCAADGVEGKLGSSISSHTLIELPEPGFYQFEFDTPRILDVEIRSCQRDGLASIAHAHDRLQHSLGEPAVFTQLLPAGVHVVRVTMDDTMEQRSVLSISASVELLPP
jgi:hypothetical protein